MHHRSHLDGVADARWVLTSGALFSGQAARRGLYALLFACGLAQAVLVYMWAPWIKAWLLFHALYVPGTAALVLALARAERASPAPRRAVPAVLLGGFVAAVVIGQAAMQAYSISADEYGYGYLADTFLHGRLWNEPLPDEIRDAFKTHYITDRDGKRVSQYAPGWPAVLAVFKLAGLAEVANALLGLLAAALLWLCLRRVPAAPGARVAALALGALAPFTLFNNASFYTHTLTATALLAVLWLDLRDAETPSVWNRAGIGFAFSVLLVTRYEAFLIAFALFALDGLVRKRARFIAWAWPAAVAGLPLVAALLWYNWSITGNPLQTTLSWASPWLSYGPYSRGVDGQHSPARGLFNVLVWGMRWHDFACVLLLPLYAVALRRRVASGTVRWFDLLLPGFVVFFFFFPDDGGLQHGPRYFYLAHAAMPVTLAAGFAAAGGAKGVARGGTGDGLWRLGRWTLDPVRLAAAQLCAFAGFSLGYAATVYQDVELRLTPPRVAATAPAPAVVLVTTDNQYRLSWQRDAALIVAEDYTRHGLDGFGPVAVGVYTNDRRARELCAQMPDRRVFRLILRGAPPAGHLEPVCE